MPVRAYLGQVLLLFLFLFCHRDSNSGFIRKLNLDHHILEIKLFDQQPRVKLFLNHPEEKEKKELSFVLDTGSNVSLIRKNIFFDQGERKSFRLKSITGEIDKEFKEIKLNVFDYKKNLIAQNFSFHSLEFNPKFEFDGIIGNDILEKFDVFLELPQNAFLLAPSIYKSNLHGFKKVPYTFSEGHIILKAKMEDQWLKFLLDTGAGISYLSHKKATELNLKIGGKASYMDFRGELQETIYHFGENLCVDENICQKKIELMSGNSIEDFLTIDGKLDGILGLNWIEKYSILIDYSDNSVYIKQRK